jgi:redox-sensitive bicupin YhaK (pirin superfamily)
VRVAVGSFQGVSSPLVPADPLDLLDVELRQGISFDLPNAHYALVYVLKGGIRVRVDRASICRPAAPPLTACLANRSSPISANTPTSGRLQRGHDRLLVEHCAGRG